MEKPMGKTLIVGIVMLFLSTACLPVLASEGKPDLIIEQITIQPGSMIFTQECYCTIKNIGNATSSDEIEIQLIVKRKPLGIFPLPTPVFSDTAEHYIDGGLKPGDSIGLFLTNCDVLPIFGFFQFKCTVNPGKTIEESNYDNNDFSQNHFNLFNIWI